MNSKVVILGSTGFIGAALLTELQQHTNLVVEGYHSANLNLLSPGCVEELCEVVDDETILIVTARSRRTSEPFDYFLNEMAMTMNLARSLSKKRIKKCLYFSTTSVYGDGTTNLSMTEETAIAPTSFYGTAKFASECAIKQVTQKIGTPLIIFRPCMVYGPHDTSHAYGPARFIRSILREGKVYLFGDGAELRDYLFIQDLIQITIEFAFNNQRGIYNLATGQSHSFQKIIDNLRQITKPEFEVIHVTRDRPKTNQKIDITKLLEVMPSLRFIELEQGLAETYQYFS